MSSPATTDSTTTRTSGQVEDLYPSRQHDQPRFADRRDPVIHGEPGTLSAHHRRAYTAKGFLALAGFLSPQEVEHYQGEADRLRQDPEIVGRPETITEPESDAVRSIFAVHRLSGVVDRLVRDPRILGVVQEMLGGDVYVHQSRINFKPAFRGKEFYWHSDFETWHVEDGMPRMRAVSCSISLTENNPYNGPLMLIPGSHEQFLACVGETPEDHYKASLKKQEYGVPDDASLAAMADRGGIEAPTGPAGSATFFECNVMHGSASNISPWPRSNIFVVYNSVENALVEPFSGQGPRPEFIANRTDFTPLEPAG